MRDELGTEYFLDVHEHQWAHGVGHPAGIYWLNGRSVIAAHSSRAEQVLIDHGAILVATLLFEPDPLEGRHEGHCVERLGRAGLAEAFVGADRAADRTN
jgi:hypothetical protein